MAPRRESANDLFRLLRALDLSSVMHTGDTGVNLIAYSCVIYVYSFSLANKYVHNTYAQHKTSIIPTELPKDLE